MRYQLPPITRLKIALQKRLWIMAWVSLVCLLMGQLGRLYWPLELFAHFVPYYAVFIGLGCCCTSHQKWRPLFAVCAVTAAYWCITPEPGGHHQQATPQRAPVRLLSYNVLFSNKQMKTESQRLIHERSDVIFLTEVTPVWENSLHALASTTQHCAEYSDSPYGMALYSRLPLTSCAVHYIDEEKNYPYIRAELADGLVVYGIHPPPPINGMLAQQRNTLLRTLAS